MKRLSALVMALILMCSVCAVAESSETVTIGNYTLTANGFTCSSNSETDIDLIFNDGNIMGNLQYMSYESLGISYSDFEILGLTDAYAIADMFVDAVAGEDMLATVEKENLDFAEGVSGLLYYGVLTESYDGMNYCGLMLVDENAIFSCLCIGLDTSETAESLRAAMDTFLTNLSVVGSAPADDEALDSIGQSIGDLLGNFAPSEETAADDVDATDTDAGDAMAEGIEIGAHTVYAPSEWNLTSNSTSQLIYTCGDTMILLGVYDFGDSSIMENALSVDTATLESILNSSTVEGLNAAGFDASTFSFKTVRYSLTGDRPIIHFEGDASALMSGYYLTGATMLTDADMAMIMILSTTDSAETIDAYLWQAIGMFCD